MASRPTTADEKSAEAAKIAAFKLHEAEVETQEEWDELMALQGLVVIDVYQVKINDKDITENAGGCVSGTTNSPLTSYSFLFLMLSWTEAVLTFHGKQSYSCSGLHRLATNTINKRCTSAHPSFR